MTGFIKEEHKELMPIVGDDFTHAMCLGRTGCGKTSSFILPNIEDRMKKKFGMLILDYKGLLHLQVKALAHKNNCLNKVIELGSPWGSSVNLLKNTNKHLFLESLRLLSGKEIDAFWTNSSLNLIGYIYDALALYENMRAICKLHKIQLTSKPRLKLNLLNICKVLENKKNFEDFSKKCENFLVQFDDIKLEDYTTPESIDDIIVLNEFLHKFCEKSIYFINSLNTMADDSPSSGTYGVFFQAQNIIQILKNSFFSGEDDIVDLLNQGKIIVLKTDDLPPHAGLPIMNILYKRLTKRYDTAQPISLIMDEFQRSITKESLPHVDVFREKKIELIAALQNIELLEGLVGKQEASAFMQNMVSTYEYQKDQFIYKTKKSTHKAKPIFFTQNELDLAQLAWQKKLENEFRLPKDWIYINSINSFKTHIKNIYTNEIKDKYIAKHTKTSFIKGIKQL